jgi:hypothetical protein
MTKGDKRCGSFAEGNNIAILLKGERFSVSPDRRSSFTK